MKYPRPIASQSARRRLARLIVCRRIDALLAERRNAVPVTPGGCSNLISVMRKEPTIRSSASTSLRSVLGVAQLRARYSNWNDLMNLSSAAIWSAEAIGVCEVMTR